MYNAWCGFGDVGLSVQALESLEERELLLQLPLLLGCCRPPAPVEFLAVVANWDEGFGLMA